MHHLNDQISEILEHIKVQCRLKSVLSRQIDDIDTEIVGLKERLRKLEDEKRSFSFGR